MPGPVVIETAAAFRAHCDAVRAAGGTLGFVPTMGALHAGHLTLARFARAQTTHVALSIFVNPTQFGAGEDLEKYPRPFEADVAAAGEAGVNVVFAPSVAEMYPAGERTRVRVAELQDVLCGASRPGHFDGVATVVTKLFALAGPCVAVFGRKDYQQLKIVERMVRDLLLPVKVLGHAIVRDVDGLALSSRNRYLSPSERAQALAIPAALRAAELACREGASGAQIALATRASLATAGLRVDYAEVVEPDELSSIDGVFQRAVLAVAAFSGATRLIDNVELDATGGGA